MKVLLALFPYIYILLIDQTLSAEGLALFGLKEQRLLPVLGFPSEFQLSRSQRKSS